MPRSSGRTNRDQPWWSWFDRHPPLTVILLAVFIFAALRVYSYLHDGPVLLSSADAKQRLAIYGEVVSTAVALLGISLTILTILLALPDRPIIHEIREGPYTWRLLRGLLMVTALLALSTMVAAQIATGIDNAAQGREWLQQLIIATAASTVLALTGSALTFWLILVRMDDPPDPGRGRGEGAGSTS
jgi:hypothetical protein